MGVCQVRPQGHRRPKFAKRLFRLILFRKQLAQLGVRQGKLRPDARGLAKLLNSARGIAALFKKTKTATIIHGHTHRPALHHEKGGMRWVLPRRAIEDSVSSRLAR